ncbi:MAG: hypothetical protein WBB85_16845, partial [Albidovulum sp.]|uniref:hypothetical protein n=1 Tax=Albidovulum sp. TaxID=1872424 RepID=UPI003CC11585
TIPLSGTGTVGEIIEGRAVSVDDAGATTTAWADVDAVAGGGTWAGTINVPRSASWYRPEVRIKSQPAVSAQGTNRFGSGHMWAIWGQSEISNSVSAAYSLTTPVAVSDPEAVQVYHGAGTATPTTTRTLITTGTPLTAAMAAMASTLIGERPGEKFAIIMQAKSGTDPRSLSNDGDTSRLWSVDKALHDFATADGRKVGLAAMSWFASPGSLAAAYGEAMLPLFSKKTLAGADVTIPGTVTYTGGSYQADHWFGELYDYTHTKWVPYGPHRFDPTVDLLDATHDAGGAINTTLKAKEDARASWRAMLAVPSATMFMPLGMDVTTYSNGVSDGSGGWTDEPHPSGWTDDGQPQWMRLNAAMLMESAGLTSWATPEFDNCLWEASGAYVEVWSSEGPITTTRIARSEAALPATFPHWTEVVGFQINGVPAQNATIVAGRVRITPNGGGNFIFSDVINFGEGGATGQIQHPEDNINALWKNLPIVDVGVTGLDGVPVRPIPNVATLANTLPAAANFTTVAGQLTRFKDPVNWPTTDNKITFEVDILIPSFGTTNHLCEMDNVHIGLQVAPNSHLFLQIKDSAGVSIFGSASIGTVTAGVRFLVRIAANITTNELWTTINGITTTRSLLANTGQFASAGRGLALLSRSSGTSNNTIGTVYSLKVWNDVAAGGGVPASGLLADVSGPAAVANVHPWKLGGNVV